MNLHHIDFFYFLGIGGIGMSSLARYFHIMGKTVYGYDKNRTYLTKQLEKEGISIHYHNDVKSIPQWIRSEKCMIVYTPAIPFWNPQWKFLKKNGKHIKKRSQVLSLVTQHSICIAIGGAHGKTTTCSLLAHILYIAGIKFTAFIGGISKNYQSNLILNGENFFLVEADEFDHSFLHLSPNISCITSFDQDHVDIYPEKTSLQKAYINFLKKTKKPYKKILLCKEQKTYPINNAIYYSVGEKNHYYSDCIFMENNKWYFDFHTPEKTWKSLPLPIPGMHNIKNTTAALAISDCLKIHPSKIRKALYSFKGIERRFSIHYQSNGKIYIDDYAHHPTEIKELIHTIRTCYPKQKILGIFQPHLFSRTKFFEHSFAKSLEKLDFLILLDIYPSREDQNNHPTIDSNRLLKTINMSETKKEISRMYEVLDRLEYKNFDILITIGAGDIDKLIFPIQRWLRNKYG
ncbi:UDP-N-acetylmuramate--L-alanine ligase [Blattabacterium cuenoti]|uniref:UDP-N-acetylmuramate--L-alanine ligase n=1 Tax=Blattabacterium cuenoti TaxID=1653831 RepID=UPI00163CE7FB|nr:UDP-N-acetylmuramate--L-alanine ligase [Blattabacterium cuenoti]